MGVNQNANLRFVVIKKEAVSGTPETITSSEHFIRIRDPIFTPTIAFDNEGAKHSNGSHAEDEALSGSQSGELTMNTRVTFGGAVATPPQWWGLAEGCGCAVISYTTLGRSLVRRKAQDDTTYTIFVFDVEIGSSPTASIAKFAGCAGNMIFTAENTGGAFMANFTFTGKFVDYVDAGAPFDMDAATQTQLGEVFLSSAFTIGGTITGTTGAVVGGTAEKVDSFAFDIGNAVTPIMDQSEATGFFHHALTDAKPRFSCNPLAVKQATRDWLNETLTEVTSPIVVPMGTNLRLTILEGQNIALGNATREGLANWDLNFRALHCHQGFV